MNRTFKYISLVLALLFVIAGTSLIAFADEETPAANPGETPVETPAENPVTPEPAPADPVIVDPGNAGGTGTDPGTGTGTGTGTDGNSGVIVDNGSNGAGYIAEDPNQTNNQAYNNNINNNSYNTQYGYDEYGDGTGNEEAAGSVTSNTTLYQSSGLSDKDAAPNQWSEITLDEKTVKTGTASFKSIKTNSNEAVGEWIVYLGYFLIGLAVLGILYFIIATIAQRRYDREMERLERRGRSTAPPRSVAGRMEEQERRQARASAPPRTSRYADEAPYYSRRASSKADTGEVYVPRRTRAK